MNTDYTYIEHLIELFFEGETTQQQEEELYAFFNSEDIPDHLLQFRPIFGYFETTLSEEIQAVSNLKRKKKVSRSVYTLWRIAGGVAAVVCLFFLLKAYKISPQEEFYPFEGSYIVRNGVKITDPALIEPELRKTIEEAERLRKEVELILNSIPTKENVEINLPEKVQTVSEQIEEIVESYSDEYIKQEVRKTLLGSL